MCYVSTHTAWHYFLHVPLGAAPSSKRCGSVMLMINVLPSYVSAHALHYSSTSPKKWCGHGRTGHNASNSLVRWTLLVFLKLLADLFQVSLLKLSTKEFFGRFVYANVQWLESVCAVSGNNHNKDMVSFKHGKRFHSALSLKSIKHD